MLRVKESPYRLLVCKYYVSEGVVEDDNPMLDLVHNLSHVFLILYKVKLKLSLTLMIWL